MRIYENKLGITCIEADEGYTLKKDGQTFKKAYLGKNDRAELYEEVVDTNYISSEEKESESINISNNMILVSPNGKRFKLIVNNDGSLSTKEI